MKFIKYWGREILLILFFPFFDVFGLLFPLSKLNPAPTQNSPIIIVERWMSLNPAHILMKNYLEKRGFTVYLVNFSLLKGDFIDSARGLEKFIKDNNLKNITLVGVSFGTITSYIYLQRMSGWEFVNKFISVAGTFGGTPRSYLFPFMKSGRQMTPRSKFVKELRSEPVQHPERIVCLRAIRDEMVPMRSSSELPGVRVEIIPVYGHNNLHMISSETFDHIAGNAV